jgi:hypothetical protein
VDSSDFAASLEARREMWMATSSSGSTNDGRGVDLAVFGGIWTYSSRRVLLNACHIRVDRLEPKREAPQARSQDRLQAGGISCASIEGDDEEVSETQTGCLCRFTGSRAAKFGYGYAATDSLWQQGSRSEAWRPLSLGWVVCPTWS